MAAAAEGVEAVEGGEVGHFELCEEVGWLVGE